jgi:hypothetical protein
MNEDKKSPAELAAIIESTLHRLGLVGKLLLDLDLDMLLKQFAYNDAVGALLNPTLYRANMDNAWRNEKLVRAAKEFRDKFRELFPEIEA